MSNYKFINPRNIDVSLDEYLSSFYKLEKIDNASCVDLNKNIVCGIINLNRNIPYINYLFKYDAFKNLLSSLKDNDVILIDYHTKKYFINKDSYSFNNEQLEIIKKADEYFLNYGGHLLDNGELVYDLKSAYIGPHYTANLLLGDRSKFNEPLLTTPKSVVDAYGGGSFRGPSAVQVLATKWDMSPDENGSPFNRQFYLLENNKQIFYSHNVHEGVKSAYATMKVNRAEIEYELESNLKIKRIIYIKDQEKEIEPIALERQVVIIKNDSNDDRELEIVFTGMFGSANPNCQMVDVIYQTVINQSMVLKKNDKYIALMPDYFPEYAREYYRFFTLGNDGFDSFSYDLTNFIGNGDIFHPENINSLGNELKMKGPSFFAVKKKIKIKKNNSLTLITSTGLKEKCNDKEYIESIESILDQSYLDEIEKKEKSFESFSSFLQINTKDKLLNSYVNRNLAFQVLYQTYVSRAFAQTQKGYREIGFREIQDLYASMNYFVNQGNKELVKKLLSKWIENVYEFGYANHNFYFEGKEGGMCSDDALWLVDAIKRYIDITSDYEFLKETFSLADNKENKRSLYDTLKAIITYSAEISIGKHFIPLLDKADWNDCLKIDDDCLDGPTKEKLYYSQLKKYNEPFGSSLKNELSESVMNGFLLVIALKDMIDFAKKIHDEKYLEKLNFLLDRLVKSLKENAYINGYYARVLINKHDSKYKYVGSFKDGLSLKDDIDGSIYLNSFSWSILSGVASEEEIKTMIESVDKYLKTKAGYVLCTPHDLKLCGSKEAATEQYFLGDRENGGVFKHATMMFVFALLKASQFVKDKELKKTLLKDAEDMIKIVLPYNVLIDPYKYKGNPRFCTQYVNSINEEHIGPILSGTSTWLLLVIMEAKKSKLFNP